MSTLLVSTWLVVVGWQVEEHLRVVETAKSDLRNLIEFLATSK